MKANFSVSIELGLVERMDQYCKENAIKCSKLFSFLLKKFFENKEIKKEIEEEIKNENRGKEKIYTNL